MARILLTWELGSGFGHVASLASIATALLRQGHEVVAALRDTSRGETFFSPIGIPCIAVPKVPAAPRTSAPPIATYADLLASVGFNSSDTLLATLAGWDRVFSDVAPDVVVFDHSPFALLAAMNWRFGKVQHGTSFYIPPDTNPLPSLRPWLLRNAQDALEREERVLSVINQVLEARDGHQFERLADLYSTSDEQWLATYEELDHFGERLGVTYRGITPPPRCTLRPAWPDGHGPRVFAYLQPDGTTLALVRALGEQGYPTIARISGVKAPSELQAFKSLKLVSDAVDVQQVASECDLAVLSGGHGTLAAVLLAGKPVVIAPIQLEQLLLAKRCEQLGLGLAAPPTHARHLIDAIKNVLAGRWHSDRAASFAARYDSLNLEEQLQALVERIEDLAVNTHPTR